MPWRTFIDIMIGAGEGSRSVHIGFVAFYLDYGATTRAGMLSNPLRSRFWGCGHRNTMPTLT